jgi:ribonuclease P protein component
MSGQQFPRAARLLVPAQFDRVLRTGVRVSGKWFRAQVVADPASPGRLGITIAKRAVALSVARNRLRRQIRERFRRATADFAGFDLVVIAKNGAADVARELVAEDLVRLFAAIAALKQSPPPGTIAPLT